MTLDPRIRRYLTPTRIVWSAGTVVDAERLLAGAARQAGTSTVPFCRLRAEGGPASLLLDFGAELHGGLRLTLGGTGPRPAELRVRFGESISEALAEPFPEHGHAIHEHLLRAPAGGSHEVGQTGFRFARVDLLSGGELELADVCAVSLERDCPRLGAFRCDDARLERIWEVGARTVHLCLQDFLWDGIKRDRLVWIGDAHPELRVVSAVFGALDVVTRTLDFARENTPLPGWMNGIPSYSMSWLLCQRDWWMHHGDRAYLESQRGYLIGLTRQIAARVDGEGREHLDAWRFIDWPSEGNRAVVDAALHALSTIALIAAAELCAELGERAAAQEALDTAARLRRHRPDPAGSKQAAALIALAGLAPAAEIESTALARSPTAGISTFYGYYVLQARALAGAHAACLDLLRAYWGRMLDLGATTFWEDFDLAWAESGATAIDELPQPGRLDLHRDFGAHCYKGWRHSLCHGWAAGPTAWLSEHVLGFRPLAPGCARLLVAPRLGGLAWAEGAWPTPRGPVRVRHERRGERTVSTIDAPPGIEIVTDVG